MQTAFRAHPNVASRILRHGINVVVFQLPVLDIVVTKLAGFLVETSDAGAAGTNPHQTVTPEENRMHRVAGYLIAFGQHVVGVAFKFFRVVVIQAQAVFVGSYPKGSIGIFLDNVNIFYLSPSGLQPYALETVGALVIQKQPVQIGSQPNAPAAILKNRQHHSGRQFVRGIVAIHFTVGVQPVYPVAVGSYPHPARRVLENAQHTLRPDIQLGVEEVQSPVMESALLLGYHQNTFLVQHEPQIVLPVFEYSMHLGVVHVNAGQIGIICTHFPSAIIELFKPVAVGSYPHIIVLPFF